MRFKGDRVRLVKLEIRVLINNSDTGEEEEVWLTDRYIYAEKWERQGKEGNEEGQLIATQDVRWKVRHIEGLNKRDYRIIEGENVYLIQNIQSIGRNEGAWVMCELRDNESSELTIYLREVITGISGTFEGVVYADHLGLYVAIGPSNVVMTSTDLETWSSSSLGHATSLSDIAYSSELEMLCACGSAAVYTSTDANTWTKYDLTGTFKSVDWSSDGGYFVSLGNVRAAYSPNGTGWGEVTIDIVNAWNSITSNDNVFTGVSTAGRVTTKAVSNPASSWTSVDENNEVWNSIAWSDTLNKFVAVGENGAVMAGDSNGMNWSVSYTSELNDWQEVVWASDLGKFIACSDDGTNRFIESEDGVTWTTAYNTISSDFNAMTYTSVGKAIVAVTGSSKIAYLKT